jgi:hypothetical protein
MGKKMGKKNGKNGTRVTTNKRNQIPFQLTLNPRRFFSSDGEIVKSSVFTATVSSRDAIWPSQIMP